METVNVSKTGHSELIREQFHNQKIGDKHHTSEKYGNQKAPILIKTFHDHNLRDFEQIIFSFSL